MNNAEIMTQYLSEEEMEELKVLMEQEQAQKQQQLETLALSVVKMRDEAIKGRESSSIEEDWDEDEDAYEGIDNANRDEMHRGQRRKPDVMDGQFGNKKKSKTTRSTLLLNITRPYVDGAAARVGDMLLPTDDKPWQFKLDPLPDAVEQMYMGKMGPQAQQQAEQIKIQAKKNLEQAEKLVEDRLVECQYHNEVRKVIEDCARIGTGVLKGPFAKLKASVKRTQQALGVVSQQIVPASKRIDPWNLYPDPACNENIQNGRYVFERDVFSAKQIKELKQNPDYLADQIDLVLEEGPNKRNEVATREQKTVDSDQYEIWYFTGDVELEGMGVCGCPVDSKHDSVPATLTVVNDRIIHAAETPVDSDDFPYDVICWQRRKNYWAGIGVARQIRTPQRILTAAGRNMMDNAGVAAGPMYAYKKGVIKPVSGAPGLGPHKGWEIQEDSDIKNINEAISIITIPMMQQELQAIVQFAMKMAEDSTGLPQLMQGNQGQAPDTVGGMNLLNNNANVVLRRIARNFDDYITEPHIRRHYKWLREYDGLETEYHIDARGSSALVERDIQNQAIMQMGQMVINPAFGINPAKWMEEWLKAMKFDPKRFKEDEDGVDPEKSSAAKPASVGVSVPIPTLPSSFTYTPGAA